MPATNLHALSESRFRREFLTATVLLALAFAAVLLSAPEIDLAISAAVRHACALTPAGMPWCPTWPVVWARRLFMALFILIAIATLIATVVVVRRERRLFGLSQARCQFVIAALIVGPGVVANLVLKDNLGRARPRDVIEFGGARAFTPPLVPSGECTRNCSFVSGEASSLYAAFFALAFVLPQYRRALLVSGLAAGTLAGSIRIVQGAHFLSDVIFAGLIMAVAVGVLHIVMIGIWRHPHRLRSLVAGWLAPAARAMPFARSRG